MKFCLNFSCIHILVDYKVDVVEPTATVTWKKLDFSEVCNCIRKTQWFVVNGKY